MLVNICLYYYRSFSRIYRAALYLGPPSVINNANVGGRNVTLIHTYVIFHKREVNDVSTNTSRIIRMPHYAFVSSALNGRLHRSA